MNCIFVLASNEEAMSKCHLAFIGTRFYIAEATSARGTSQQHG